MINQLSEILDGFNLIKQEEIKEKQTLYKIINEFEKNKNEDYFEFECLLSAKLEYYEFIENKIKINEIEEDFKILEMNLLTSNFEILSSFNYLQNPQTYFFGLYKLVNEIDYITKCPPPNIYYFIKEKSKRLNYFISNALHQGELDYML